MDDDWAMDGLDEALASAVALAEDNTESKDLIINISLDEPDYYDWNRTCEMQNLQNGLFSESSNPEGGSQLVSDAQPRESVHSGSASPPE